MIPHTKPSKKLCKQYRNEHAIKPEKKNLSPTYTSTYSQPPNTYTPALFKIASWVGSPPCVALSSIPRKHYNSSQHDYICFVFYGKYCITHCGRIL